jgi:LEA14-like dessication related protein
MTLLAVGCAGLSDLFKDPDVHLNRVVIRGASLTGGTLDLVIGVMNPNHFELKGTEVQLGFDVQDTHVGDVDYNSDFQVPQGDSTLLTLPVSFTWSGVSAAVRAALTSGDIPYKMKGQLTLETPLGRRSVPFSREGRAPLMRSGAIPIPTGTH